MNRLVRHLATALAPDCNSAAIDSAWIAAASGHGPLRTTDGRRTSGITPSGIPFEASVSVAPTGSHGFRYLTETATAAPFFVPRLTAQRAAIEPLIDVLPPPAQHHRTAAHQFVDHLFPEPAAVPARSRFALWFGITHHPAIPDHIAGLKVYANASLSPQRDEYRLEGDDGLAPHGASFEIAADGSLRRKVYWRADPGLAPGDVIDLAKRQHVEGAADVVAALGDTRWDDRLYVCRANGQTNLALHVRTRDWGPTTTVADDVLALTERLIGQTQPVELLFAAMDSSGLPWQPTVIGFGLGPDGPTKVNVYVAPVAQ